MKAIFYSLGAVFSVTIAVLGSAGGDLVFKSITTGYSGKPPPTSAGGDSGGAVLSQDGRWVVFVSAAKNFLSQEVAGDRQNVYVRDRQTGTINLVSVAADGSHAGDGDSFNPAITPDGQSVVFESRARNLVTNLTHGVGDIFIRNLASNTTALVSIGQQDDGGSDVSRNPSITADGRYVLFESMATNLVENSTLGVGDLFRRDLQTKTTVLASVSPQGNTGGNNLSWNGLLSEDGRIVVYQSKASNLVDGLLLRGTQLILRDLPAHTNALAVRDINGNMANPGQFDHPLLSADGSFLVFRSSSTNLAAGVDPTNTTASLYGRDLKNGTNRLIVTGMAGVRGDLDQAAMTPAGRFVVFIHTNQVLLWDAQDGQTKLVSVNTNGLPASGTCGAAQTADDGQTVLFISNASDLVANSTPASYQVYAYDVPSGLIRLVSSTSDGAGSSADCIYPILSANGHVVAFEALDNNLAADDFNRATDVFARDLGRAEVELISRRDPAVSQTMSDDGGILASQGISADGRYILFTSISTDLVPNNTNQISQVFLHDRLTGTNLLVSFSDDGINAGDNLSILPVMTPDARFVAFVSRATNLVAPGIDASCTEDFYMRDIVGRKTTLVSANIFGKAALKINSLGTFPVVPPAISADGRYVAFMSQGQQFVTGQPQTSDELYLRDLQTANTTWLSQSLARRSESVVPLAITPGPVVWYLNYKVPQLVAGMVLGSLYCYDARTGTNTLISDKVPDTAAVTQDGEAVAYWSRDTNSHWNLYLYRPANQSFTLLLTLPKGSATLWKPRNLRLSADGRLAVFAAPRSFLGDANDDNTYNVLVTNTRQPGNVALVSVNSSGQASGNGWSQAPQLSGNGRYVVFQSAATDLVPGSAPGLAGIYVRDLELGITRQLDVEQAGSPAINDKSLPPAISGDGQVVAFTSTLSDLVSGDFNQHLDVFSASLGAANSGDSDHDGLPDDWEVFYFGDLSHDGTADSDGDGMSDKEEYLAGTNPVDPASVLRLRAEFGASASGPLLSWPATVMRTYQVQYKDSWNDTWHDLVGMVVWAGPGWSQIQDTNVVSQPHRYYRLAITD